MEEIRAIINEMEDLVTLLLAQKESLEEREGTLFSFIKIIKWEDLSQYGNRKSH